ncbi:MAG: hypothetical protein JWL95_2817 [Gemmatimonadetes bacterium]|nr:hypothetical protein [Gemmatimonadota bacterium]
MATRTRTRRSTLPAAPRPVSVAPVYARPVVAVTRRPALDADGAPLPRGQAWPPALKRLLASYLAFRRTTWARFAAPYAHAQHTDEPQWLLLHSVARELCGSVKVLTDAEALETCLARATREQAITP